MDTRVTCTILSRILFYCSENTVMSQNCVTLQANLFLVFLFLRRLTRVWRCPSARRHNLAGEDDLQIPRHPAVTRDALCLMRTRSRRDWNPSTNWSLSIRSVNIILTAFFFLIVWLVWNLRGKIKRFNKSNYYLIVWRFIHKIWWSDIETGTWILMSVNFLCCCRWMVVSWSTSSSSCRWRRTTPTTTRSSRSPLIWPWLSTRLTVARYGRWNTLLH